MKRFLLRRCRFTLVELLVMIAISGVVVGILLTAVQAVREAAGRMACNNSFKQSDLGVHNYRVARNQLPIPGAGTYVVGIHDLLDMPAPVRGFPGTSNHRLLMLVG